jgi:ABC-type nickel/cobalt efflux system permease component RcnA
LRPPAWAAPAAIGLALLLALADHGAAQTFTGPPPRPTAQTAAPSPVSRLTASIRVIQQRFYKRLSAAVTGLKEERSAAAAAGLIALAFAYGIFHAAGPGHGKAVITAYLLADRRSLRRGVALAALAALTQALTAIALVFGFVLILEASGRQIQLATRELEVLSYAMVAALGLWLTWRALAPLAAPLAALAAHDGAVHHHHHHHHVPGPEADRPLTWRNAWPVIASIGIRPCTGAIVVLVFAHSLGLYAAGIVATLSMAVGTALTVSVLAVLAVGARDLAGRLAAARSGLAEAFYRAVAVAGSLAVLFLGVALLLSAIDAPARPFG